MLPRRLLITAVFLVPDGAVVGADRDLYATARQRLVDEEIARSGIENPRVLNAVLQTPRHEFVPRHLREFAYHDMALPIGDRQTISSPFIVAFMTECIDPQPSDKVLEIGTGSGYQAAVLSPLAGEVYSIEIVAPLGRKAAAVLKKLKYSNVHTKIGDGFQGWAEHAPFDKIIVTCSPENVPQPLVDQLAEGGLMVIPMGERYQQTMYLMKKTEGKLESEALRPTLFVPMTGTAEGQRAVAHDPDRPAVINGSFETIQEGKSDFIPGWYYSRQVKIVTSDEAPIGDRYAEFQNQDAGRDSRVLQGLAMNGKSIRELELSAWVHLENVTEGPDGELPRVMLTFYDQERREVGRRWLGPWRGTQDWTQKTSRIRVPPRTREAILRIGLLGGSGKASFDGVRLKVVSTGR